MILISWSLSYVPDCTIAEACLRGDKGKHALHYLCIKMRKKEPKLNSG